MYCQLSADWILKHLDIHNCASCSHCHPFCRCQTSICGAQWIWGVHQSEYCSTLWNTDESAAVRRTRADNSTIAYRSGTDSVRNSCRRNRSPLWSEIRCGRSDQSARCCSAAIQRTTLWLQSALRTTTRIIHWPCNLLKNKICKYKRRLRNYLAKGRLVWVSTRNAEVVNTVKLCPEKKNAPWAHISGGQYSYYNDKFHKA